MRALLLAVAATLLLAAPAAAAPQWLQPVDLAGPTDNYIADVAVAADGTTLVAFSESNAGSVRVAARVRRPGEGFGPRMEVSPGNLEAGSPSVAVDGQGNFTVAFVVDDPTSQVRARRLPAGAGA